MFNKKFDIPTSFELLSQKWNIVYNEKLACIENAYGMTYFEDNRIELFEEENITSDLLNHTFIHELVHLLLLYSENKKNLYRNECYVDVISGLLHQHFKKISHYNEIPDCITLFGAEFKIIRTNKNAEFISVHDMTHSTIEIQSGDSEKIVIAFYNVLLNLICSYIRISHKEINFETMSNLLYQFLKTQK